MLRWVVPILIVIAAIGPAVGADGPVVHRDLQRPHTKFRPTIVHDARHALRRLAPRVDDTSELLFTPAEGFFPPIPPLIRTPLLPGSSTLPGYYGSNHSYEYKGPYYGGPNLGLWNRLPYACGVYGYC